VFTKLTSVTGKFGFYTGPADHVPKENVNKNVGSSWLHKLGMFQHFSYHIRKHLNIKTSALS